VPQFFVLENKLSFSYYQLLAKCWKDGLQVKRNELERKRESERVRESARESERERERARESERERERARESERERERARERERER
jgi:hypothetical protein